MKKGIGICWMLVCIVSLLAVSLPLATVSAATEVPSATVVPTATPVPMAESPQEIVGKPQVIHDQVVPAAVAALKRVYDGDVFYQGRFERPFDQGMKYLPGADISLVALYRATDGWIYVKERLVQQPTAEDKTNYALELDLDRDGRGDFLIWTTLPTSKEWSTSTVTVWQDKNTDVEKGGVDTPAKGDGYETQYTEDAKVAYARLSPDNPLDVQFAFKQSLIGGVKGLFLWRAWTSANGWDAKQYPPEDHFTIKEAGVGYFPEANYPLKAVWGVDNTCRAPSGYNLYGPSRIKGSCVVPNKPD